MLTKSISIGVIALATAGFSLAANKTTFEDLQSTTSAVKTHADALNVLYRTTGYDWNAEHLQAIRDETNHIGKDLRKLQEGPLTPTEERALNRAIPLLQTMAADTAGAIHAMDEKGRPVDTSGTTLAGTTVDGLTGLRALLLGNPEQFPRTVTEKLMAYALGRMLEYSDKPAVRRIVRDAAPQDYRWSSIILGIVESPPFLMRASRTASN